MTDDPNDTLESSSLGGSDIGHATAHLREEHRQETKALQHLADRFTALVGWPGFIVVLALAIGSWIGANLLVRAAGATPVDAPPFFWLQGAMTVCALFVAALILTTQRREDELAQHRAQLILELLILNDRKISKIVELIEEMRRDSPSIQDRVDRLAAAMSTPSDAHAVLDAIREVAEVADHSPSRSE